jgi:hypothetical protein
MLGRNTNRLCSEERKGDEPEGAVMACLYHEVKEALRIAHGTRHSVRCVTEWVDLSSNKVNVMWERKLSGAGAWGEWSFKPLPLYPLGMSPRCPSDRRLDGPWSRLDAVEKRKILHCREWKPGRLARSLSLY